jgi:hypothetical protein
MTGKELKALRYKLGMKKLEYGRMLGFLSTQHSLAVHMHRLENQRRPIPLYIARLAWLIDQVYEMNVTIHRKIPVDPQGLPAWPHWPRYTLDPEPEMPDAHD